MSNQIYPCLWFDNNAKEAAEFYCSVFKQSKIIDDTPMVVTFSLDGQKFMGLNGGPMHIPNPSISFFVICQTQEEIDDTWRVLLRDGKILMPIEKSPWSEKYGWLQDRFGISWQLSLEKIDEAGPKILPVLMFTNQYAGKAEEAMRYYISIFENSSISGMLKYEENENEVIGNLKNARFKLDGHEFMVMDSSLPHEFSFNEGISIVVECKNQKEIDYFWDKLSAYPEAEQCGWLKDKFGVSWQIVPAILSKLMNDPSKSERVTRAFLQMKKFEIEKLVNA